MFLNLDVKLSLLFQLGFTWEHHRHANFPYRSSRQWEQDMLECVKHDFQVCRCPAFSHTYTHRRTEAQQLLRLKHKCSLHCLCFGMFRILNNHQCFFIDNPSCLSFIFSALSSGWQIQLPIVALTVFDWVLYPLAPSCVFMHFLHLPLLEE